MIMSSADGRLTWHMTHKVRQDIWFNQNCSLENFVGKTHWFMFRAGVYSWEYLSGFPGLLWGGGGQEGKAVKIVRYSGKPLCGFLM